MIFCVIIFSEFILLSALLVNLKFFFHFYPPTLRGGQGAFRFAILSVWKFCDKGGKMGVSMSYGQISTLLRVCSVLVHSAGRYTSYFLHDNDRLVSHTLIRFYSRVISWWLRCPPLNPVVLRQHYIYYLEHNSLHTKDIFLLIATEL